MRADTRKPFTLAFAVDAVELAFVCPLSGRPRQYRLPADRVVACA